MPVLLSEEDASAGIFENVAKYPSSNSESTASQHERHENEHTFGNDAQKILQQSKGGTGPAIPPSDGEDLPPKASKEELKARSEELNK